MWLRMIPILVWLALCGCTQTATYHLPSSTDPVVYEWPRLCPLGHSELRQIPVRYGLLHWTPELREQEAAVEFWAGGCTYVPGYSPHEVTACTRCRHVYHPNTQEWVRRSTKRDDFDPPFDPPPLGPMLAAVPSSDDVGYTRTINNGQVSEEVWYRTREPPSRIKEGVGGVFEKFAIVPSIRRERGHDNERLVCSGSSLHGSVTIQTVIYAGDPRTYVNLRFSPTNPPQPAPH